MQVSNINAINVDQNMHTSFLCKDMQRNADRILAVKVMNVKIVVVCFMTNKLFAITLEHCTKTRNHTVVVIVGNVSDGGHQQPNMMLDVLRKDPLHLLLHCPRNKCGIHLVSELFTRRK